MRIFLHFAATCILGLGLRLLAGGVFLVWMWLVCAVGWRIGLLFGPLLYRVLY
jgi:hypothetical protein